MVDLIGLSNGVRSTRLHQVPKVTVQVGKDGDAAVGEIIWWADDLDILRQQVGVVPFKIIGKEEEKYPASGLVADEFALFFAPPFGQ